ncbi:tetratricopeptide repeat protein [Aliishimia ponticola]|uniref:Tetratricopeptide repeat protein n=2 Tax=Aliishimia ponticola TaxID=2499833 RepID=A0A4S4NDD6_9RHOB|nr:tetratricopeptide repeat protein [Aliishimia ponticola]
MMLGAGPVLAECPDAPDQAEALRGLIAQVQDAPNEMAARLVTNRMWELWSKAPDAQAQAVLDRGMRKRASYDFLGAIEDFDLLIDYCPDYAEGYNQRAFVRFIKQDYLAALADLSRALDLAPDHIAARAGLALTFMELGELDRARAQLRIALRQNPWLPERHLLAEGGRLAPQGDDI